MTQSLVDVICSTKTSCKDREEALIGYVELNGKNALSIVRNVLKDSDQYVRSAAVLCLGRIKGREVYADIINSMLDPEEYVRCDAVIALGETGDSRGLFTLSNYFKHVGYEEKKRVLIAMKLLADPRAIAFLDDVIRPSNKNSGNGTLKNLAEEAKESSLDRINGIFTYTYHGREANVIAAENVSGQICLRESNDLNKIENIFSDLATFKPPRPQSYIVDLEGNLFIGGYIMEHVDVAKGNEVLAAGEIFFEKQSGKWSVSYVNNRSNGYYPDGLSSFKFVKAALNENDTNIKFNFGKFSENFPKISYNDPEFLVNHPFFYNLKL